MDGLGALPPAAGLRFLPRRKPLPSISSPRSRRRGHLRVTYRLPIAELSDSKDGITRHSVTFLDPDDDAREYYHYMNPGTPPELLPSPSSVIELYKEDTAPLSTKKNDNPMDTGTLPETQPSPSPAHCGARGHSGAALN